MVVREWNNVLFGAALVALPVVMIAGLLYAGGAGLTLAALAWGGVILAFAAVMLGVGLVRRGLE